MPPETLDEQLTKYLTDAHSIEVQALRQMKAAPDIAGDDELARIFREHCTETEDQEKRVATRLEQRGAKPNRVKDVVAWVGGVGMILFARANPDTPGKLVAHAYSYEHMELAAYELLALFAQRAGDSATVEMARAIGAQEAAMAERLAANFDRAVEASLREKGSDDPNDEVVKYLADAHAIEAQAVQLLKKGPAIAGETNLAKVLADHLAETRSQQAAINARLDAHGSSPNKLKDAAMRIGALNWGGFFAAQPDTPAKLAGFAFAFEHLEVGGYEQLKRVAQRAGDDETERVADRIIAEERAAAGAIRGCFADAVEATIDKRELTAAQRA
jgi:ferritin-like metal-binding protein YciE